MFFVVISSKQGDAAFIMALIKLTRRKLSMTNKALMKRTLAGLTAFALAAGVVPGNILGDFIEDIAIEASADSSRPAVTASPQVIIRLTSK